MNRIGLGRPWVWEVLMAVLTLAFGFAIMPMAIYYVGESALGRYEGASLQKIFDSLYHGFSTGSGAAWIVLFGPYGLYLIFKALRLGWRAGAKLA